MKKLIKIIGIILAAFMLLFIIGLVRLHFATQHVVLDGPSMEPTIHNGQSVLLKPYKANELPRRGDIVEYSSSNKLVKQYSKSGTLLHRIIALPGERITINNNNVLVYNSLHPNGFNPDATYLPSNVVTSGSIDLTLNQNTYFIMGDNRPNALDSRAIGPVALNDIIGKVQP